MPADSQRDVIIGPLKLNRRDRSLSRNGVAIPLGGRALDVLGVLAESAGETVGKDDLLNRVWPGLTVEENNLQVQISTLRKALGEGWILTIPGRGYQLALPPGGAGSPPADELLSRGASIAVLPFVNNSGDAEQAYFTDGVTEEIITVLSRVRWLSVIAQNSSFTYRDKAIDVKQIGQELGVRYVLKGSVRRSGDRIRITGQLIDAVTEANLWADRFEGTLDDIFDLQDCFAGCVVGRIEPRILSAEIGLAQRKRPDNLHAHDLLLRALWYLPPLSPDTLGEATRLLRQAIDRDPDYPLALAQLALCHWAGVSQGWVQRTEPVIAEAITLARRALALGGEDSEVLSAISPIIGLAAGDLYGGIALVERALSLNPNCMGALSNGAILYAYAGETEKTLEFDHRAGRLNPLGGRILRNLAIAIAYFAAGRYLEVLDATEKMLLENASHAPALRYRAGSLGLLGRINEGEQVVGRLRAIQPDVTVSRIRSHLEVEMNGPFKTPGVVGALCEGLRRAGMPD